MLAAALLGLRFGLLPISDNSAFTHLATGLGIARDHAIPRSDPYSFTALGHGWVVQSWLPVSIVGWLGKANLHWVVLLSGLTSGALAACVALLGRTGRWAATALATSVALLVGMPFWGPRPLLVGLVCFALTLLAVTKRWPVWCLVPVGWVWVQSHGSFPLGVLWCVTFVAGLALERRQDDAVSAARVGLGLVGGVVLGAVNPLGPKLLWFPVSALEKREVFSRINEWKPVNLSSRPSAIAVLGLAIAAIVLVRRRPSVSTLVPLIVFVPLGLLTQRNMAPLGIVVAWAVAASLIAPAHERLSSRGSFVVGGAVALVAVVLAVAAWQRPAVDDSSYPVGSVAWIERHGRFDKPHRVIAPDYVGNYMELRRGARAEVFIDDRIDMFPVGVTRDYIEVVDATARADDVLAKWKIDTVVWPEGKLTRELLKQGWSVGYAERPTNWVVLLRSST